MTVTSAQNPSLLSLYITATISVSHAPGPKTTWPSSHFQQPHLHIYHSQPIPRAWRCSGWYGAVGRSSVGRIAMDLVVSDSLGPLTDGGIRQYIQININKSCVVITDVTIYLASFLVYYIIRCVHWLGVVTVSVIICTNSLSNLWMITYKYLSNYCWVSWNLHLRDIAFYLDLLFSLY